MIATILPPLLRAAPVAIACLDLEGRVLDANQALLDASGYTLLELKGLPFSTFLDPGDETAARAAFVQLVTGITDRYRASRRYRTRGGDVREVDLTVSLVRDDEGLPKMCLAVLQDVTERKRTEEALRLSDERYRALVEQSPLSIQILAPDGTTRLVNSAWERLWGATLEQIGPYNMLEDRQLVDRGIMPFIQRAFAGEATHVPAILYNPDQTVPGVTSHPDPRRWVSAVMYPLKDDAGGVREVVLMHQDITDQMRAEEQRRAAEQERERLLEETRRAHHQAEAASRVKDEFLATLSHELRTPLNAILGWAHILSAKPADDETRHALAVIERNAAAQARLIDDLLDVSRMITGKLQLRMEPVDLATVAASALECVRPAAGVRGLTLDADLPPGLPRITGDPQRLQQIFWNLLTNAVKFTEPGGRVSLRVEHQGRVVRATVTDTGIGIAPGVLPYVFDRFTQGDSSATRAHAGLGLGLAIARHLVELHGGTIVAESAGRGSGSTFRVEFPSRTDAT